MGVNIGEVTTFHDVKPDKAQVVKIGEECMEVYSAWENFHGCTRWTDDCGRCYHFREFDSICPRTNIVDECADLITATCNLLAALGVDDMRGAMDACEQRNRDRGRL